MDYHILGPLEVVRAGEPIDLGRPRQRAVLAVLLLSANRVMSLDRLIELLWDGEAPARATGALQAYISNLRRALEPSRPARTPASILVTQAPGYVLRVAPEQRRRDPLRVPGGAGTRAAHLGTTPLRPGRAGGGPVAVAGTGAGRVRR